VRPGAKVIRQLASAVVTRSIAASRHGVVHAAGANLAIVGVTTIAGVLIARTLGAEGRGYYAAIMAWFALAQVLGEVGQSGAVTFWVSKDPARGKNYVASARLLMLVAGGTVSVVGILASELLSQGVEGVTIAYQIAFAGCLLNSLCASYVYGLQAVSIKRWNAVRLSQPVVYLLLVASLSLTGTLNIVSLSGVLVASTLAQFVAAIQQAYVVGLAGGKARRNLLRDLSLYGIAYSGSAVPATLSSQFDRLVLSRVAAPAQLGEYAVASTVAGLVLPFSTAVASVAFPRSASAKLDESGRRRIERRAILGTAVISGGLCLLVGAAGAPLIPLVFGDSFTGSVELVWWLIPAILFRSVSQVVSALLRGRQRPGLATYGQLAGLATGALTIFPLIGWLGIRGAALAASSGELVVLVVAFVMLAAVRRKVIGHPEPHNATGRGDRLTHYPPEGGLKGSDG